MSLIVRQLNITFLFLICSFIVLPLISPVWLSAKPPDSVASYAENEDLIFIRNLFKDKIYRYAKQEIEDYYQNYPESSLIPEVIFIQAQINVVEGRFEIALRQYKNIISQYPQSEAVEDALYFGGSLKLQLGQESGLVDFDRLLVKFPKTEYLPKINYHKGELRFKKEDWQEAEALFKKVLESENIDDELRLKTQHSLAWIYYFTKKSLLAKSLFFELLESPLSTNEKAKMAFQLGLDSQQNDRYNKAITWFERQLTEWPDPEVDARSKFWIAECYYLKYKNKPDTSSPEEQLKAIELYSNNLQTEEPLSPLISRYHRGWLLTAQNKHEEAESDFAYLQKNSQEYAADIELTAVRAKHFEATRQLKKANLVYTDALKYEPTDKVKNMLLISIIRNADSLKDCKSVIDWKNKADLSETNPDAVEIKYYSGRCHFKRKEWKAAKKDFSGIPMETQYARAVFPSYLETFKKTRDYEGGRVYLDHVEAYPQYGSQEKILLLKIDFSLTLNQWAQAIDVMLKVEKMNRQKSKDPWYLLNIAQTSDKVYQAYTKKKHPIHKYPLKKRKFYANLSLNYYKTAYEYLPKSEKETRLSVLDILITRYKSLGSQQRVVSYYRDALTIIDNKQKQDELRLAIATILLYELKQTKDALLELHKIHNNGNSNTHYEASTLLAELYVQQNKQIQAIKILEDLANQPIAQTEWYSGTHFRLAELYQANERWQKAVNHYNFVVKENKNDIMVEQAKIRAEKIKNYLQNKG